MAALAAVYRGICDLMPVDLPEHLDPYELSCDLRSVQPKDSSDEECDDLAAQVLTAFKRSARAKIAYNEAHKLIFIYRDGAPSAATVIQNVANVVRRGCISQQGHDELLHYVTSEAIPQRLQAYADKVAASIPSASLALVPFNFPLYNMPIHGDDDPDGGLILQVLKKAPPPATDAAAVKRKRITRWDKSKLKRWISEYGSGPLYRLRMRTAATALKAQAMFALTPKCLNGLFKRSRHRDAAGSGGGDGTATDSS
mmetsp:Transcript_14038/g.33641  ORF Transcript_14038/g.33641 Transcript_14038/m.33641 type:complete len:255 (-) Transcript_14038:234-998(-)